MTSVQTSTVLRRAVTTGAPFRSLRDWPAQGTTTEVATPPDGRSCHLAATDPR